MNSLQTPTIKAVFFDIDGTLFSLKNKTIPESTKKAINSLRQQGIKVIVATGRSINDLSHVKDIQFDGFMTFNGGYCMTVDGHLMFKQALHHEDIQSLITYSASSGVSFSLMYEDKVQISHASPKVKELYNHVNIPVPPLYEEANSDIHNVLQVNVFIEPEDEISFMQNIMPNSLSSRWTPLFADVNPAGISKKRGVELFCEHFKINVSETMAFGDGGNDISMLKYVKIGIAMGNANDNVKESADYVTFDVDQDGIQSALKHFGLLD
ncbi:Cof-type HAD-IIB family hydrolase [Epilithonimonas sp.]|uniref:Cof-type HAD-IIB family hydrolase n=1 Tax=Epilithonimonas sp. TaxID=2894511 RepID=UPI00289C9C49|nr:Cof-type HAD-IIB family hydrolase [Epilithonimonas sp.]